MLHLGSQLAGTLDLSDGGYVYRTQSQTRPIRLASTDRLVVCPPGSQLTPAALARLWRDGLTVCYVQGSAVVPVGPATGPDHRQQRLRQCQHRVYNQAPRMVSLARSLVAAKTLGQAQVLSQYQRRHARSSIGDAAAAILRQRRLLATYPTVDALRGAEGQAASQYWSAISGLAGQGDFRREPRSAADPLNLLFDCAYSWLTQLMALLFLEAGADLALGCLHTNNDSRPTLALDLMEPLRPVVADRFVLAAWRSTGGVASDWFQPSTVRPGWDLTAAGRTLLRQRWRTWIWGGLRRYGQMGRLTAVVRRWCICVMRDEPWPGWTLLHDPVREDGTPR